MRRGRRGPATRARAATAGGAGGFPGGAGHSPCGAGGFCLEARMTTVGGVGDLPGGAGGSPCGASKGGNSRRRGRFALRRGRRRPATRARAAAAGGASACLAARVIRLRRGRLLPCGSVDNSRWRAQFALWRVPFALRLCTEVVRVYTQVPARLITKRWRWTAATPTAGPTRLTPLRVTDQMSIGPRTRRCMSTSASRLVLRARWPDRGGRWDPGHC